ncbi:probable Hsp70 nucleotide exchange factor FES1 [Coccomyxa sp. Obi]|nr:probable Hsp70 nucleotide exchange factor FES1 [Coccomyxa sp. Obi]
MHCIESLLLLHLVVLLPIGICIEEGAQLSSVDVLQNGSVQYTANYDAVDLNEATTKGMSDGEMKDLLHWAIKHSDPKVLQDAASGKIPQDATQRQKEVQEAIEYLRHEPGEAELMKAALEIINNVASGEEARLHAFDALCYLLEPVDNANDLHKIGGIEVLLDSLGDHNSKQLRAAAANALGVAASNNEEFVQRLWEICGADVVDKLLQLARLENQEAAGKALYALSNLLHNEKFRRKFFEARGLATLQRPLAGQDTPPNVRRKALALLADLAHYQETPNEILKLPERGRQLVREIEYQLSIGDWDLTEKALLALKALAEMPGGSELLQGTDPTQQRLQKLIQVITAELAGHEGSEYMEEVKRLAEEVQSTLRNIHMQQASNKDAGVEPSREGDKNEL